MKTAAFLAVIGAVSAAKLGSGRPKFTVEITDPSLTNGVGSLNLEGEYSQELTENVDAGVTYKYNSARGMPASVWVKTRADLDDDTKLVARAEFDVASKATAIEASIERGDDSVTLDFDTADNKLGPVKITKALDLNGRRVRLSPSIDIQERTGELVIDADIDGDTTRAELTVNPQEESAELEVSHKLDERNRIAPRVNLKSGDIRVKLNRDLERGGTIEVTADRKNVDWELTESSGDGAWTISGNIPLEDAGKSAISFKRSVEL